MTVATPPTEMRMQRMGASLVFLQPLRDGKAAGASLMVELQSGTVGMAEHSMPLQDLGGSSSPAEAAQKIWGIIGLAKLIGCSVLAVITNAEKVLPWISLSVPALSCSWRSIVSQRRQTYRSTCGDNSTSQ